MSAENLSVTIEDITPMIPRFRVFPLLSRRPEDSTAERVLCHRLDLEPATAVAENFFDRRKEKRGYVYRSGLRGDAKLVAESFGTSKKGSNGAYEVKTSWAGVHPGSLASYLPMHHGRWNVVTFSEPTATPPERLPLPKREKPRRSRSLQPSKG
jgi:hypothetical protein